MLVLRVKGGAGASFEELLQEVRRVCLGAYAHQDLPFEKLVEDLKPERDLSRNPLFQVMFVMMNASDQKLRFGPAQTENLLLTNETAKFDLQMFVRNPERTLKLYLEYSTDLYEGETIGGMVQHYARLLGSAVAEPKRRITELAMS